MEQKIITQQKNGRNLNIDVLKGLAIIAVVLYHLGWLTYGYLGVDIFFVVNGYFITNSLVKDFEMNNFNYFKFLSKRIIRLAPLVLIAGFVVLVISYFTKLPDDLENVGETVVASNLFINNILACITTHNYWDIANPYQPMMHTWYLGILMQCYLILPLILLLASKLKKHVNGGGIAYTF
jgi:peptidoglycan/LPS O-acetylase OafA/YrhL